MSPYVGPYAFVFYILFTNILAASYVLENSGSKKHQYVREDKGVDLPVGVEWELVGDRYLSYIMDESNWEDAQDACVKMKTTLLIDNLPETNQFLIDWGEF